MKFLVFFICLVCMCDAHAKTVRYELTIANDRVNLSGKKEVDFALSVNGGIPAPILEFTEGDEAEIVVKNRIPNQEASIHWHGILLPSEMDGVPYVNSPPIASGGEFVFRFKIRQHGTYWYHSHTMTQEQEGVYGAIVIHPKKESIRYNRDLVVVLSDWSDESGESILKNLRKDGDYYLYKKGTMRSWLGAIQSSKLGVYLSNEWTRMGGMDYSDVGYDAFLMNGKKESNLGVFTPGEKIRIRIINAAASTYFYVSLGQSPLKVISADGVDIEPTTAKKLLIGMAETYDVLYEVPKNRSVELRATSQDGTGYSNGWIGSGEKEKAVVMAAPDLYMSMDHEKVVSKDFHGCNSNEYWDVPMSMCMPQELNSLTVDDLKAKEVTAFPISAKVYDVKLVLGGDMRRYVWHINNKAIHEDRNIVINEGDVIRFTFENGTMMHHPMHLHGHFFRVLNQNGDYSPMKHTVDVPPHGRRTIEFRASEPGEWMLHCHNLFHMHTGMARVVKYSSYTAKPELAHLQHRDHHLHDPWFFYATGEFASNHAQGLARWSQTWNEIEARVEARNTDGKNFSYNDPWELEGDLFYHRWFGQYFHLIAGATAFDRRVSGALGAGYLLPMLIESRFFLDHRGKVRLEFEKRFQWAKTIFSDVDAIWRPRQGNEIGHDFEWELSLMYSPSWSWAAGLMLTDRNIGAGVQLQF